LAVAAGLAVGCAGEDVGAPTSADVTLEGAAGPDSVLATDSMRLTSQNALSLNALSLNALSLNALSLNALSLNALSLNAASASALSDPSTGASFAEYIKYAARCMLRPDQSVTVKYKNASGADVTATFPGNLALQPEWANRPLSASDNLWLGACLAAHVNAAGIPVSFSSRGPHPSLAATKEERQAYPLREGAFFATWNPTSSKPWHFYTCFDDPTVAIQSGRTCSSLSAFDSRCGDYFTLVARCTSSSGSATVACEGSQADGAAVRCHLKSFSGGAVRDAAITQVITSFTKRR
jgi:hypothetical protein